MEIFEWIRFIVGTAVLLCGLSIFVIEIYGIFHLRYVLNRMHAAAMGDTLGISISLIGLMIFSGINFTTLKRNTGKRKPFIFSAGFRGKRILM